MKKLKQKSFFQRLAKLNLSISMYTVLYKMYVGENVSEEVLKKFPEKLIKDNKLTDISIKIIEGLDSLFATNKTIKIEELMGLNYKENIDKYIKLFPSEKLPSGKYARANPKNVEVNFKWFFSEYEYSWQTILAAAQMYVAEYRDNNYLYMRTAVYFIRKDDGTRNVLSDLANYCSRIESGHNYSTPKIFKTNII